MNVLGRSFLLVSLISGGSYAFADYWATFTADTNSSYYVSQPEYAQTSGGGDPSGQLFFGINSANKTLTIDEDFRVHKFLVRTLDSSNNVPIESITIDINEGKTFSLEEIPQEGSSSTVSHTGDFTYYVKGTGTFNFVNGETFASVYKYDGEISEENLVLANLTWDFTALESEVAFNGTMNLKAGNTLKFDKVNTNGKSINLSDAVFIAKELNLGGGNASTFTLTGASELTVESMNNGTEEEAYFNSITASDTSKVNITGGNIVFGKGTITANDSSEINISIGVEGSNKNWTTPLVINDNATVRISKNVTGAFHNMRIHMNGSGTTLEVNTLGSMDIFEMDMVDGSTANLTTSVLDFYAHNNYENIWGNGGSGVNVSVNGTFQIKNGALLTIGANSKVKLSTSTINLQGTLTLNGGNIFTNQSGEAAQADCININFNGSANSLILNADNSFYSLGFSASNSVGKITLNGNSFSFETLSPSDGSYILFTDFEEGKVYHYGFDVLEENDDGSLKYFKADDGMGGLDNLYVLDNGYLTLNIPEPSTYAILFGIVSLGAVLARRRK